MRAFLAIELPDEVKGEILRIGNTIRKSNLFRGKFVELENLHLTLKFFGEVIEKEAGMIYDVLQRISFPAFSCKLGKLGFFGDRVLWINIEDDGSIKKLHNIIDEKLGDFFDIDERFHNHVTIARIKSPFHSPLRRALQLDSTKASQLEKLKELINKIKINPIEFSVSEFKFKKSELRHEGPVYEDLYGFELR